VQFVDFVDYQTQPHDGYGHGTHVAGIIAGSGFDSDGARRGIAPGAHLIVLKALDEHGDGFISSAIAAIDYAIEQRAAYNIRVINLSVAPGCTSPTRPTRSRWRRDGQSMQGSW
jgi:serine protease AprX